MKKSRCQLCGGKIRNGRCELCGWINQTDKEYLLNKSRCDNEPLTHVHKEETFGSWNTSSGGKKGGRAQSSKAQNSKSQMGKKSGGKRTLDSMASKAKQTGKKSTGSSGSYSKNTSKKNISKNNTSGYSYQNVGGRQKKKKTGFRPVAIIILFIAAVNVLPYLLRAVTEVGNIRIHNLVSSVSETSEKAVEDENYEYVTREISPDGVDWTGEFDAGQYVVGVDIPEGTYELTASRGKGGFRINDNENSIYLYEQFSTEPGEDEILSCEDIRLYEGARVDVQDGLVLGFATKNAQSEEVHGKKNPLKDTILLQKDGSYVAGESFDAGVYDISCDGGWGNFSYEVPLEDGSYEYYFVFMDSDYGEDGTYVYHNVTLPEGTQVTVENINMTLTPSERIVSENYLEIYEY